MTYIHIFILTLAVHGDQHNTEDSIKKTLLTLQANIKISTFPLKGKCYYMGRGGGAFLENILEGKKKTSLPLLLQKI